VILDAGEDVGEVLEGVDAASLACRDERVEALEARAALDVVDEEVVLAAERDATESALGAVVVEGHAIVVEDDAQLVPLVVGVAERDADGALGRVALAVLVEPGAPVRPA
jgi:hypothetical protein